MPRLQRMVVQDMQAGLVCYAVAVVCGESNQYNRSWNQSLSLFQLVWSCCCLHSTLQGALGVSWAAGADSQATPPPALDLSTVEAVQAAMQEEAGSMHASLLHLLMQRQPESGEQDSLQQKYVDACFEGSMIQMLQALHVFQFA